MRTSLLLTVRQRLLLCCYSHFASWPRRATPKSPATVAYRERIALPADAVINVQLLDTSVADVAAQTVAEVLINAEGRQVPVPFTLTYDPAKIVPGTSLLGARHHPLRRRHAHVQHHAGLSGAHPWRAVEGEPRSFTRWDTERSRERRRRSRTAPAAAETSHRQRHDSACNEPAASCGAGE